MDPMKLSRSVAEAMARDVRDARWKILRKISVEDAYFLMKVMDDLETISHMNWHASLARSLDERPEVWIENMELDEEDGHETTEEMADFERQAVEQMREMIREPMTVERLKKAEDLIRSHGVDITLVGRSQVTEEIPLN